MKYQFPVLYHQHARKKASFSQEILFFSIRCFRHILYHILDHKENIRSIMNGESEKVFTRYFTEYLESAFGEVIVHMDVDVPDAFKKQFVIGSFIHTVKWWIGKGLKEKPEKIIDSYMKCLPGKNE